MRFVRLFLIVGVGIVTLNLFNPSPVFAAPCDTNHSTYDVNIPSIDFVIFDAYTNSFNEITDVRLDTTLTPPFSCPFRDLGGGNIGVTLDNTGVVPLSSNPCRTLSLASFGPLDFTISFEVFGQSGSICQTQDIQNIKTATPEEKETAATSGGRITSGGNGGSLSVTEICNFVSVDLERAQCRACFDRPGVWTPFGCIETELQAFLTKILRIAMNISGGIAFLMLLYGGYVIMTSAGNPERLNGGKEIIVSAISGLLLIVFSVVILGIIGIQILQIPGFGTG